ncbi:MAG: hypothetical protein ACJA07_001512 [Rhodococcus sp. (in: high G+C Gram-positive bacteria)]|jgi:hypothetical protein
MISEPLQFSTYSSATGALFAATRGSAVAQTQPDPGGEFGVI